MWGVHVLFIIVGGLIISFHSKGHKDDAFRPVHLYMASISDEARASFYSH